MTRHWLLTAVTLAICLLVPALSFAQVGNPATSPTDVVYLFNQDGTASYTIQTYNVDPNNGSATLYGTLSLAMPSSGYYVLVPGVDDHYVYLFCACGTEGLVLHVYATDSNGAPQNPPIQMVKLSAAVSPFIIDPSGTLAYATQLLHASPQEPEYGIRAFSLDPSTGIVTAFPKITAITSPPADGLCNPENSYADPSFSLVGFNLGGTQLIDVWGCGGYDDSADYYYTQAVNQQTGALGTPIATVGAGSSFEEYNTVTFTPAAILSFQNEGYEGSVNELYAYWPNATLNFSCTYTMFDACSYSNGITTDRTGLFIFFETYTGGIEVAKLNMNQKSIEPVGTPLADPILSFSLDDRLIYSSPTLSWNGQYYIPVYLFNPNTGLVTNNGAAITLLSEDSAIIPALRY